MTKKKERTLEPSAEAFEPAPQTADEIAAEHALHDEAAELHRAQAMRILTGDHAGKEARRQHLDELERVRLEGIELEAEKARDLEASTAARRELEAKEREEKRIAAEKKRRAEVAAAEQELAKAEEAAAAARAALERAQQGKE